MTTQTTNPVQKVDLLIQQINDGYHNRSIAIQISMLYVFMDKANDDDSPLNYLDREMLKNSLIYNILNNLDRHIGNEQPFVPHQDYEQEYNRFLQMKSLNEVDDETETFASKNTLNNFCRLDDEESVITPIICSTVQHFTDVLVKSSLDSVIYSNFAKYKELYAVDETINQYGTRNNCRPFCPSQNYAQELIRQNRASEFFELIKQDSSFMELCYASDVVLEYACLQSTNDSPSEDGKKQIIKLW